MKEPVLVILAAGMGSRYGGLKQIDPVGAFGEKIIDYSLYDAYRAGFRKVVFVIKEELLRDFQEAFSEHLEGKMEIQYAFQKNEDIPEGFTMPENRVKPWGTGHATLSAARVLGDAPYTVINADDYYGREAFEKIYGFLTSTDDSKPEFAMVGYYLENTVSENGYVSRGICKEENGMLTSITERTRIEKRDGGIAYSEDGGESWVSLPQQTIASMNFWGFTSSFTQALEEDFVRFFREDVPKNTEKAEYFLPFVVNDMLSQGRATVKMLSSGDKWYGVTNAEDKASVVKAVKEMSDKGQYPSPLWERK